MFVSMVKHLYISKTMTNNKSKMKKVGYKKEQPLICLLFWTTTWTAPTKQKRMSSDQRWRLLRPAFFIFFFLFFLPHNLTFGLCFNTEGTYFCFIFLSESIRLLIDGLTLVCFAALALMKFKERIEIDPFGALVNWGELSHCSWSGVVCSHDGRVVIL